MPDRFGAFKGISVPELPWLREKPQEKPKPRCGPWVDGVCQKCGDVDLSTGSGPMGF